MNALLRDFLVRDGYQVHCTFSASGALAWIESRNDHDRPHIVLSDVLLGSSTGVDLSKALSLGWPGLPVILFSVCDAREEALASGAVKFINAPFQLSRLSEVIAEQLGALLVE